MERLVPNTLTSSPDATYLQGLKSVRCPCPECNSCLSTSRRWSSSRLLARMLSLTHTTLGDSELIFSASQVVTQLTDELAMATSSTPLVTLLRSGRLWQHSLHRMTRLSSTQVSVQYSTGFLLFADICRQRIQHGGPNAGAEPQPGGHQRHPGCWSHLAVYFRGRKFVEWCLDVDDS
jgi:hypothetical protein